MSNISPPVDAFSVCTCNAEDETKCSRCGQCSRCHGFCDCDEHPSLINIADGTEYEWVEDPPSGSGPGYANVDDHDWTWPREALERSEPVEEVGSLDVAELARLRAMQAGDEAAT